MGVAASLSQGLSQVHHLLRHRLPRVIIFATVANATTSLVLAPWTRQLVRKLADSLVLLQAHHLDHPRVIIFATAGHATASLGMAPWTKPPARRLVTKPEDTFSTSEQIMSKTNSAAVSQRPSFPCLSRSYLSRPWFSYFT